MSIQATTGVDTEAPSGPSLPTKALITVFRAYQLARAGRVSPCRYTPTCSQYAVEAVTVHGSLPGLRLAVRRLLRCRPGGPFGYDPVPDRVPDGGKRIR